MSQRSIEGLCAAVLDLAPADARRLAAGVEQLRGRLALPSRFGIAGGRVLGSRQAVLRYDLQRADAERLVRAIGLMGRLLFAAGASAVLTGVHGHETVRGLAQLEEATSHAVAGQLHVAAFHPTGTARMGAGPESHPVDPSGRLRGVRGVSVADASVLPSCPEVNPQLTIMALATAVAERVVAGAPA